MMRKYIQGESAVDPERNDLILGTQLSCDRILVSDKNFDQKFIWR